VFDSAVIKGKFNRGLYCAEDVIRRQKKFSKKIHLLGRFSGIFPGSALIKRKKTPTSRPLKKTPGRGRKNFPAKNKAKI